MKEILIYSALGTLAFGFLNTAWIWLLTKAEASRTEARIEKQPATAIMGAKFQFEPSGDYRGHVLKYSDCGCARPILKSAIEIRRSAIASRPRP